MVVRYALTLDDHLAWFDYYTSHVARPWSARLPIVGRADLARRRSKFAHALSSAANAAALGERSIELSADRVREFSSGFDFSTAWQELAFAVVTSQHLFLAHPSMNAHIIPLRSFDSETAKEAFIRHATSHAPSVRDHRHA